MTSLEQVFGYEPRAQCGSPVPKNSLSSEYPRLHQTNLTFLRYIAKKGLLPIVLWKPKEVFLAKLKAQRTTITKEVYCETWRDLRTAIQNKRDETDCLHVKDILKLSKCAVLIYPQCSPDFTPIDIHLFRELKTSFGGQCFNTNRE